MMKLFKCEISSGGASYDHPTIYVVAESYSDVEILLISKNDKYFVWKHRQKIKSIAEFSDKIIISNKEK